MEQRRFRIFILGAGFSRPAGLPLGNDIFPMILQRSRSSPARHFLDTDIERYIKYRKAFEGIQIEPEKINFEEFISFLDIEHYLKLKGKDTWSLDGNESQIFVKYMIGEIIHEITPSIENIPDYYLEFVNQLDPGDIIITFNYDILLERCFDKIHKPYRLVPYRHSRVSAHENNEVIILKMHGSVDWFDRRSYEEIVKACRETGGPNYRPSHPVFGTHNQYIASPILEDPPDHPDTLSSIYRIKEVDRFYLDKNEILATPFILSPSYTKFLYLNILIDFWYGIYTAGSFNFGAGIIGYSMPEHDDYINQVIYTIVRNYHESEPVIEIGEMHLEKQRLKIVNLCKNKKDESEFNDRYRFVDWEKTDLIISGFDEDAVRFIFEN